MSGVQVRWDSPVAAVGGKNYKKIVTATGVETVGDLLGIYPRRYVRKGSLSELEELNEGDILSLVGEVVSSVQKPYQDRRTHRTAYRLEVRVRAQDGSLLLTYFDKHKNTAEWRANQELPVGSVGVFSGRLKWFNNQWQLTNPASRMYGGQGQRPRRDARPDPALRLRGRREHLAVRGHHPARPRPGGRHPRAAACAGAGGRGPHRGRPGTALDPPARQLGPEGLGREAAQVRRGVRRADRARPSPGRDRGHRRQPPPRRAGGHPRPVRRAAPVRADRRPAQRGGGDRRRARRGPPDAPVAAGRGRLGQDGGRAARDAPGGRLRWPGGAARADRGARPAARALDHGDARRPRPGWPARWR